MILIGNEEILNQLSVLGCFNKTFFDNNQKLEDVRDYFNKRVSPNLEKWEINLDQSNSEIKISKSFRSIVDKFTFKKEYLN